MYTAPGETRRIYANVSGRDREESDDYTEQRGERSDDEAREPSNDQGAYVENTACGAGQCGEAGAA